MTVLLVFMAALQEDWSAFELRRDPPPEEVENLRERIGAWASVPDIPELSDLGRRIRIVHATEFPIYRVTTLTLTEERELAKVRKPYRGGEGPKRTVTTVDVWGPPTPKGSEREWRLPVEGSVDLQTCGTCGGKGEGCGACDGAGRFLESFEIVIRLKERRSDELATLLEHRWCAMATIPEAPAFLDPADFKKALLGIRNEILRASIQGCADRARERSGRVAGQRVGVARVPVIVVDYELNGGKYEVAAIERRLLAEEMPAQRWSAAKTRQGRREHSEGALEAARTSAALALKADARNEDARRLLAEIDLLLARSKDWRWNNSIAIPAIIIGGIVVIVVLLGFRAYFAYNSKSGSL